MKTKGRRNGYSAPERYSKVHIKKGRAYFEAYLKSTQKSLQSGMSENEAYLIGKKQVESDCIKFTKNENFKTSGHLAYDYSNILIDYYLSKINNQATYYFIEDNSLLDFFQSLDFKDLEINESLFDRPEIIKNEKIQLCVDDDYNESGIVTSSIFVLNSKKLKYSLIIRLAYEFFNDNKNNSQYRLTGLYGDGLIPLILTSNFNASKLSEIKKQNDNELLYFYKLILGFFCYISVFTDSIKDGAPDDAIIFNKEQKSKTIKSNEIVKRSNEIVKQYGLSPHLRRGHFRHLDSDFYKKKKGKIIFIEPTFIKGTAKTIIQNNTVYRNPEMLMI
jgi:hypothetical protein